ncbi:SIR2 family protein [uncultured Oscillibacter sp.]|uniref:SIR2 family protein n=1 Tax=uncultured Oscillibacter sp. TaxID=876091 RepID=UPI00262D65A8|nr:SIR2 family protein [uncultured Oscillibacter sp.]
MQRNVVVPFLGAGISKNYGYPGWNEFLRSQAQNNDLPEILNLLESNEYEKAASKLHERLNGSMEFMLMQTFGDHRYKNAGENPEIEFIPKIFRSLILTTNFDEVIELLYAKVNGEYIEKLTPMTLSSKKVIQKRIACGEPTLIKLHGDIATREFVLTEQEYNTAYGAHVLDTRLPLPEFLHDVLLSKIILFLGCSLEDDRTLRVVEQSQIDGSMSFALLQLPAETENEADPWTPKLEISAKEHENLAKRQAFLNEHNIIPIWYPYKKYEALKIFLMALAHRVNPECKLSITIAHNTLNHLLSDGTIFSKKGDISEAFHCFSEAEKMLEQNYNIFTVNDQIQALKRIKSFNETNGYAIERRVVIKKLIRLTKQASPYNSLNLAICYHDLGYTYERYLYYRLMLKAMIRSSKILESAQKNLTSKAENVFIERDFYDKAALIYTSLGYAYLKNGENENAKIWYQKASELCKRTDISKKSKAFILNGLHRYYNLLGDTSTAIRTLDAALQLRRELFNSNDGTEKILPQHIINSHSNKIRIYLGANLLQEAEDEYFACMSESNIKERLWDFPDARRRILEDYGDILQATGRFSEAYSVYKKALQHRRYLHIVTDIIAANLYLKMAKSLEQMDCLEKALEYLIQSYVLQEKTLGKEHPDLTSIIHHLESIGVKLSYDSSAVQQRIEIQSEFLEYRYDERIDNWEDKLIKEFEL